MARLKNILIKLLTWAYISIGFRARMKMAKIPGLSNLVLRFSYPLSVIYWEPQTIRILERLLEPGDIVLDIGAHFGYLSLVAARCVGNSGKVYAFEPCPDSYNFLLANIKLHHCTNIIPIRKAVSNETGTAKFYLSYEPQGSSLACKVTVRPVSLTVDTVSLDDFFRGDDLSIKLIKMDIEGGEMLALQGMSKLLHKNTKLPIIISEFCPRFLKEAGFSAGEFLEELSSYGFQLATIDEFNIDESKRKIELTTPELMVEKSQKERWVETGYLVNLLCCKDTSFFSRVIVNG